MSPWPKNEADVRPTHPWLPREAECPPDGTVGSGNQPNVGSIEPGVAPGSKCLSMQIRQWRSEPGLGHRGEGRS